MRLSRLCALNCHIFFAECVLMLKDSKNMHAFMRIYIYTSWLVDLCIYTLYWICTDGNRSILGLSMEKEPSKSLRKRARKKGNFTSSRLSKLTDLTLKCVKCCILKSRSFGNKFWNQLNVWNPVCWQNIATTELTQRAKFSSLFTTSTSKCTRT